MPWPWAFPSSHPPQYDPPSSKLNLPPVDMHEIGFGKYPKPQKEKKKNERKKLRLGNGARVLVESWCRTRPVTTPVGCEKQLKSKKRALLGSSPLLSNQAGADCALSDHPLSGVELVIHGLLSCGWFSVMKAGPRQPCALSCRYQRSNNSRFWYSGPLLVPASTGAPCASTPTLTPAYPLWGFELSHFPSLLLRPPGST